jgi:hypothetical protein
MEFVFVCGGGCCICFKILSLHVWRQDVRSQEDATSPSVFHLCGALSLLEGRSYFICIRKEDITLHKGHVHCSVYGQGDGGIRVRFPVWGRTCLVPYSVRTGVERAHPGSPVVMCKLRMTSMLRTIGTIGIIPPLPYTFISCSSIN